jgi:hypothetical protein
VAASEVLFADGDETYDLIVMLDRTAEIIQGYSRPGATVGARYSAYRRDLRVHSKPTHGMIRMWRSD